MNIASMSIALGIDLGGLSKGLSDAEKLVGSFGKRISNALNTQDLINAPAIETQANLAAKTLADFLRRFSGTQKPLEVPVVLTGVEAATRQAERLGAIAKQARDASGRFVVFDVAPIDALDAALAGVGNEVRALATTPPIDLKTEPAIASADALITRLAFIKQAAAELQAALAKPIAIPPVAPQVASPPVVVPPPDFSRFLQETERAIKAARAEIITGLNAGGVIEASGVAAGLSIIRGLETGALSQVRGLGKKVAAGLIDPAEGMRQADLLIEAVSREMRARQGELAAVVKQARQNALGTGSNLSGVTTARSGGFVSTAELDAAEKAFDRLQGVSEATNQSFLRVGSSSSKMAIGVRGAASNLSILAAQSIGATGAVGTLAQNILLFSGGIPVVAAVAAAVLALAKVYEFLNTKQREADERSQKLRDGLRSEVEQLSATETATLGLAAAIDAEAKARESLFTKIARPVANTLDILASPGTTVTAGVIELQRRQQEAITKAVEEQGQAQKDLARAVQDFQALNARTIGESIDLHTADNFLLKQAPGLVALFRKEAAETNRTLAEQNALLGAANSLEAKLFQPRTPGDDLLRGLSRQAAAAGLTSLESQKLAITLRQDLTPAERGAALALTDLIDRQQKAGEAARRHAEAIKGLLLEMTLLKPTEVLNKQFILKPTIDPSELRVALFNEIRAVVQGVSDDAKQIDFDKAAASAQTLKNVLEGMTLPLRDVGNANITKVFSDPRRPAEKLNDSIHSITRGLDSVVGAARGIGAIGDEAAQSIGSVLDLADALANVAESASTGNILAAIGASIGVIGSLFGGSDLEQQRNDLLKRNNEALLAAARAFEAGAGVPAEAGRAGQAARSIFDSGSAEEARKLQGLGFQDDAFKLLDDQAKKFGFTFEELQGIAKDNGIELLDSKGRIVAGAFDQLADRLGITLESLTQFGRGLQDQRDRLDLQNKLFGGGATDPVSTLERERQLLIDNLSSGLTAGLDQLDLGSDKGQSAFLAFLQDLFTKIDSKFFTDNPDALGNLSSVDDLLSILGISADALNELKKATNGAADALASMTNVPAGFKRAALEWAATLPELPKSLDPGTLKPSIDPGRLPAAVDLRADPGFATELSKMADAFAMSQLEVSSALTPLEQLPGLASLLGEGQQAVATALTPLDSMLGALQGLQSTTAPDLIAAVQEVRDAVRAQTSAPPPAAGTPSGQQQIHLHVSINPAPGQSPLEIAQATLTEFQRFGVRHLGDSLAYVGG